MTSDESKKIVLFGFLIPIIAGISLLVSIMLYWIDGSSFLPWANYLSDLSIGTNGANYVFFGMLIFLALSSGIVFIYLGRILKKTSEQSNLISMGVICGMIYGFFTIFIVFFPLDPNQPFDYTIHVVGAIMLFVAFGCTILIFNGLMRKEGSFKPIAIGVGSLAGILSLLFAGLLFFIEILEVIQPNILAYLVEWTFFALSMIWIVLISVKYKNE